MWEGVWKRDGEAEGEVVVKGTMRREGKLRGPELTHQKRVGVGTVEHEARHADRVEHDQHADQRLRRSIDDLLRLHHSGALLRALFRALCRRLGPAPDVGSMLQHLGCMVRRGWEVRGPRLG